MKKLTKKILSAFLALAMVLGVAGSAFVSKAQDTEPMTGVIVHKLELPNLTGWPKKPAEFDETHHTGNRNFTISGLDGTSYDGSEINDIPGYFGEGAKELAGVEFSYWKIEKEQYETMMANPGNYDTVEKVEAYFETFDDIKDVLIGSKNVDITSEFVASTSSNVGGPSRRITGLNLTLRDGYYWFVENHNSKLTGESAGKTISKAAAVPFGLLLPAFKEDGSRFTNKPGEELHVYPKNTLAGVPKTDKGFADDINLNDADREKIKDVTTGDKVPYTIVTEIPAGAEYKTAMWSDRMTEGLTLNEDIVVSIAEKNEAGTDYEAYSPIENGKYTLTKDANGFTLKLNEEGLKLINAKDKEVRVKLTYTATVNEKILVDIPESNEVTFYYGNNPTTVTNTTPKPQKPKDGSLTAEKRWEGDTPDTFSVRVKLINVTTGEEIEEALLTNDEPTKTWENLDNNIEYKVVEVYDEDDSYIADYSTEEGKIIITNHKDENPEPKGPSTPKVVTGGKRFRKVDAHTGEGLATVVFNVKKDGKFLAKKDAVKTKLEQQAYAAAEKAYKDAVKAGTGEDELATLKAERDNAYKAVNTQWEWVDEKNKAFEIVSDQDGYFKVTGLAYDNYELVETKTLKDYAIIKEAIPFEVAANSAGVTTLETDNLKDTTMQEIQNKKVTIPQTGGMGTVIFTVVGIAIMGGAIFAMRRRSQEQ